LRPEAHSRDASVFVEALAGPVRELPPGRRPEDWIAEGDDDGAAPSDDTKTAAAGAAEPADEAEQQRELRYRVQFTASQEFVDLLEEATDLIGHETPRATLPEIQVRALRALVQELRVRKRAASKKSPAPVPVRPSAPAPAQPLHVELAPVPDATPATPARRGARHIPASVRRAVFDRDGARCSYRDDRGERCRETLGLEIHHRHAHALGGPATLDNLELRCRAHNTLAAEQDFGRAHMDFARGVTDGAAPARR
jgi:5-methylcytosine-specific restriction endonuclease McrA